MTDTELPPCQLCGQTPGRNAVSTLYCIDHNCPLHVPSFTDDQWRALHAPAQVLRELVDSIESNRYERELGCHDYPVVDIDDIEEELDKAQQLSGRG